MLMSAKASASYHEIKVVEVFIGSTTGTNSSYVQLQMYSSGQNLVQDHVLHIYNANGTENVAALVKFNANVPNGASQANILIGTSSVFNTFGVVPDQGLTAGLDPTGGAVCWEALDCFSWGTFAGAAADGSVNPFQVIAGKAARRSIASGNPALLENADDGNSNVADFTTVDPAPKNNAFGFAAPVDAGTDSSTPAGGTDSGIGTKPSPNNPTVNPDSGTTTSDPAAGGGSDDSGCSFTAQRSDGWSTMAGLFAAASMFVMSRRRRNKR
jgi:hypothetical protein